MNFSATRPEAMKIIATPEIWDTRLLAPGRVRKIACEK
jgi:hypothetical protein